MTIVELWQTIQAGGTGFVLFLGAALFFTGRLVNGEIARQARLDAEAQLVRSHTEQVEMLTAHFEEMQRTWRERYDEMAAERNYYRSQAMQFANQAEQGLVVAEVISNKGMPGAPALR